MKVQPITKPEQPNPDQIPVTHPTPLSKITYWTPRVVLALVLLAFVTVCIVNKNHLMTAIQYFLDWSKSHPCACPFLIAIIIALVVVLLLPYSIVAAASGWALQQTFNNKIVAIIVGSTAVFVGAWLGALASFLLGRYIVRDQIQSLSQKFKIIRSLDKTFETQGLKFIFLLRVCLLVPFGISNYVLGGSAVRFIDYAVGSIGILFQLVFYVYVGTTISGVTEVLNGHTSFDKTTIVAMSVGIVVAVFGVIFVSYQVKK